MVGSGWLAADRLLVPIIFFHRWGSLGPPRARTPSHGLLNTLGTGTRPQGESTAVPCGAVGREMWLQTSKRDS